MMKRLLSLTFAVFFLCIGLFSQVSSVGNSNNANKRSVTYITGTDALGRKIKPVADFREDRFVGIFYFAWHNSDQHKVFDVTKILRENPDDLWSMDPKNPIAPRATYYFNEPLYGYYSSSDPYVIRKHIELFIAAGIDFIAYDFTNFQIYWDPLYRMLDLLIEYGNAGWKVPQVMFFTKKDCANQIPQLYEKLYMEEKYSHLWFRGSGSKPYLIGEPKDIPEEYHDYFNLRYSFWPSDPYREDGWPYVDKVRPQRVFTNLVSVSVAQHTGGAFSWSIKGPNNQQRPSWGRGYTLGNPTNGDPEAIVRGDNFQEQWDTAIELDPEIIFVTGWNEWIAGKFIDEDPKYGGVPYWVDTFNTEFSRDAEMTKSRGYVVDEKGNFLEEGYGDNFYMQMVENIRRYKGLPITESNYVEPLSKTIDIFGDVSQWNDVSRVYLSHATEKVERDFRGYVARMKYTQAKPENVVKEIRVTHDNDNLYFYIKTENDITDYEGGKTNWMNLFIGIDGRKGNSWEHYHYVVNRHPQEKSTSLEKFTNGYEGEVVSEVKYSVKGNVMQLEIPRKNLGLDDDFSIYFKVADSIEKEDDIMDYYVSGESVPLGRLSFSYFGSLEAVKNLDEEPASSPQILKWIILIACTIIICACILILGLGTKKQKL